SSGAELWETATGKHVRSFSGHREVDRVAVSPNGKWLVTTGRGTGIRDSAARLWDLTSGRELRAFPGVYWFRASVAFTPDSRVLITHHDDCSTRLWDLANDKELCRLVSFRDGTWAVFDPAGRFDAANGGDIEKLRWTVGQESFPSRRLRDRYYDPGLLAQYMGANKEPLRKLGTDR